MLLYLFFAAHYSPYVYKTSPGLRTIQCNVGVRIASLRKMLPNTRSRNINALSEREAEAEAEAETEAEGQFFPSNMTPVLK